MIRFELDETSNGRLYKCYTDYNRYLGYIFRDECDVYEFWSEPRVFCWSSRLFKALHEKLEALNKVEKPYSDVVSCEKTSA